METRRSVEVISIVQLKSSRTFWWRVPYKNLNNLGKNAPISIKDKPIDSSLNALPNVFWVEFYPDKRLVTNFRQRTLYCWSRTINRWLSGQRWNNVNWRCWWAAHWWRERIFLCWDLRAAASATCVLSAVSTCRQAAPVSVSERQPFLRLTITQISFLCLFRWLACATVRDR